MADQAEQLDRLKVALADRYRIERELGRGGMATVFLAEDLRHERKRGGEGFAAATVCLAATRPGRENGPRENLLASRCHDHFDPV